MKWTIDEGAADSRIDAWLAGRAEVGSRGRARECIERGKVFLNGGEVTFARAGTRLRPGDEVELWMDRPGSSRRPSRDVVARRSSLRVVFEDDDLIVLDKPAGILVEPLPGDPSEVTLRDLVADHVRSTPGAAAFVVHRIDRDTSGLVLFAKNAAAQSIVKRQFERRSAERIYLAVAAGRFRESAGTWTDSLVWDKARLIQRRAHPEDAGGIVKQAVASYRVVEQFAEAALLEVRLVTGKRNQIRIQATLHHHPLIGEHIYVERAASRARGEADPRRGGKSRLQTSDFGLRTAEVTFARQALHAARLAFRHPTTGRRVEFSAPVPQDLERLIQRLRRTGRQGR